VPVKTRKIGNNIIKFKEGWTIRATNQTIVKNPVNEAKIAGFDLKKFFKI
jgi:hypothetical protein